MKRQIFAVHFSSQRQRLESLHHGLISFHIILNEHLIAEIAVLSLVIRFVVATE